MVLTSGCVPNISEDETAKIIISLACLYGNNGIPLDSIDNEFKLYCGFSIPYKNFGADTLKSWLITLPNIYVVQDYEGNDILIEQSQKSSHIKDLIVKQKAGHQRQTFHNINYERQAAPKRKPNYNNYTFKTYERPYKMPKRYEYNEFHEEPSHSRCETHYFNQYNKISNNHSYTFEKFEEFESMLPLFYKHQALGDDFFLDIADTKLGYYVPEEGPRECGLCVSSQTISELTEKVKNALFLAPRVVVMIGFEDLIQGRNVNDMICDLRQLVIELKKRNSCVTLITLTESPKLPQYANSGTMHMRMDTYNKAILDYASDAYLHCNVIDMHTIFKQEEEMLKKDFDRFRKVAKKDPYKVFSDYGRKIFLSALRSCLKKQIECSL